MHTLSKKTFCQCCSTYFYVTRKHTSLRNKHGGRNVTEVAKEKFNNNFESAR